MQQKQGKWWQSEFFIHVGAAHDWHVTPSSLGLCQPDEDLYVMAAYTRSVNEMMAYEQADAERKRKKPKK